MPDTEEAIVGSLSTEPKSAAEAAIEAEAVQPEAVALTKALVVVGNHKIPKDGKTFVVVVEERKPAADGEERVVKLDGYPSNADLYYRTDPAVTFPGNAKEVLTLGVDVFQGGLWGFSKRAPFVHVGPAHPAFAGANLAFQRGATEISIVGLTDSEKEHLKTFFDALPADTFAPAQVTVSLD